MVVSGPVAPLSVDLELKQPDHSILRLPVLLEICGYEVITPVNYSLSITKANLTTNDTDYEVELRSLFSSSSSKAVEGQADDFCAITSYTLKTADGSLSDFQEGFTFSWLGPNSSQLTSTTIN
jgi:hypothetical protein